MVIVDNLSIVNKYINNGLIQQCVDCQFAKLKDKSKLQYRDDMFQDLVLWLLEYDNRKLNDAENNNHMNALITKILVNNLYSTTSKFYKDYLKFSTKTEELKYEDEDN